jgi:hypothetical protein
MPRRAQRSQPMEGIGGKHPEMAFQPPQGQKLSFSSGLC